MAEGEGVAQPPTSLGKSLRCCIPCHLVKTFDQFYEQARPGAWGGSGGRSAASRSSLVAAARRRRLPPEQPRLLPLRLYRAARTAASWRWRATGSACSTAPPRSSRCEGAAGPSAEMGGGCSAPAGGGWRRRLPPEPRVPACPARSPTAALSPAPWRVLPSAGHGERGGSLDLLVCQVAPPQVSFHSLPFQLPTLAGWHALLFWSVCGFALGAALQQCPSMDAAPPPPCRLIAPSKLPSKTALLPSPQPASIAESTRPAATASTSRPACRSTLRRS